MTKPFRAANVTSKDLDPIAEVSRKEILSRASLWMLALCIFLSIGFALHYRAEVGKQTALQLASSWQSVNLSTQIIANVIYETFSDLGYLARQNELSELLHAGGAEAGRWLELEYLAFLENKRIYDQARFINADGMEVVRVNFYDGNPAIVPPHRLQDKSSRYYFQQTMDLEPGQIYLSLFDLNMEDCVVESPIKPVLRISTPVSDSTGQKRGMVILNYLGEHLIDKINETGKTTGFNTWLLNDRGYWLKGPSKDHEWGFMYTEGHEHTVTNQYPQAWQHISSSEDGQFFAEGSLFTFAKVYPRVLAEQTGANAIAVPSDYHWTVVSTVPETVFREEDFDIGQSLLVVYGIMLLFLTPVSWLLARLSVRQKMLTRSMTKILNNIPVLVSYVDADQRIRFTNTAYAKFFRVSQTQLNGLRFSTLLGEDGYENVRPYVERALQGGHVSFQQRVSFKAADTRVVAANYMPDLDKDGNIRGFFVVMNDITELHETQERERQRLLELAHAQRINSMGEMATEIAHEINQPLTTITNFSTACENTIRSGHWDAEQVTGWISEIRNHAMRASEVVRRLRAFLKKGETRHVTTDINALIRDVVSWMESEMRRHNINVTMQLQPVIPDVLADDILIQQVILNLVRNAIEALSEMQDKALQLIIKSSICKEGVQVSVSDNGPGIPKDIDDQIFYSFVTSKDKGLGMGLSVSRSIVEAHGGSLHVDRSTASMTTFVFTIPAIDEGSHD